MTIYSVADAKNTLPKLIDRAIEGEEVIISRHGKPVVEMKVAAREESRSPATYSWLRSRRLKRPKVGLTSIELLDALYDPERQ